MISELLSSLEAVVVITLKIESIRLGKNIPGYENTHEQRLLNNVVAHKKLTVKLTKLSL